jgi:hypothetical protein
MCRLEDTIKNELLEIELEDVEGIRSVYDKDTMWVLAKAVMDFLSYKQ